MKHSIKKKQDLKKKIQEINISEKIAQLFLLVFGFVLAIAFGVLAGKAFGAKVIVDGNSMTPTIEENESVRINKLVYKIAKPSRMDVIVFDMGKNDNNRYFVRRIIGLPGETIQIIEGKLYVDGILLNFEFNEEYIVDAGLVSEPMTLGLDEYFVLGDNFNHCDDSRFGAIGTVMKKQIVGKAR